MRDDEGLPMTITSSDCIEASIITTLHESVRILGKDVPFRDGDELVEKDAKSRVHNDGW